ncbi:GyrI-like domain-containing protein [Kineococcus glutinatus]|uniref:AraC family transcriptional regulator n=1 Tax=Kineococcus glutinatus TaxID=1070872 RepID=A0ABP8VDC6_9ACTN
MEIVEREAAVVVGLVVEAGFADLATLVPRAWREVFTLPGLPRPGGGRWAEASRYLGDGRYREVVGVPGPPGRLAPPPGATSVQVPAGRYLHHVHTGPVAAIGEGFGAMHERARRLGLAVGDVKLDVGYTRDGRDGAHDLFVDLPG